MFNVVADQLKVSQGWVRCGQCAHVFDATLYLHNESAQPEAQVVKAQIYPPTKPEPEPPLAPFVASADTGYVSYAEEVTAALKAPDEDAASAFPAAPSFLPPPIKQDAKEPAAVDARDDMSSELPDDMSNDVSFVRDARRQAFWRKPLIRFALGLLAVALVCLLVLQFAVTQRDSLLAFEPKLKPWLGELCSRLACDTGPARRIEALVIDSSSFNKVNDTGAYRLVFLLKNTGSAAVAMPSLEVTLTDTQDQALLRRVLTPAQFGSADGMLAAGSEFSSGLTLQVQLETPPLRVAGYRLLAFYP